MISNRRPDVLASRAKYTNGESIRVYNMFDGWCDATITKLSWSERNAQVEYHIVTATGARWITDERYMKRKDSHP